MHGQFVWYELTTPDVDAARRYYPSFTGWGTQPFDKDYTMWTTGGKPFAGIFQLGPDMRQRGVPPNWMPYIEVTNIDETARQATSLGGKVMHGPMDIPNVGRFAVLQDPQGAVFGIYKSNGPSGSWDGTPQLGRFVWHELMTTDHPKALDFYRRLFGWEKTGEMDMGGGNMYAMYGKGGVSYGGIFNRTPDMAGVPPFWLVYVQVKDVKRAIDAATKGGGKLKRGPMPVPGGNIAILSDPQGAAFAMFEATLGGATQPSSGRMASKRSTAKKAGSKKSTAKRSAGKKTSARKASAKRSAGKRTAKKAAKRPAAKKTTSKKARRGSSVKSKRRR